MKGVDVSYANGHVNWSDVASAGFEFAMVRLGYGHGHMDENFYENINGAIAAGLKVGVYFYSYALTQEDADYEADFLVQTLQDCGLTAEKLPMGVWIDEEDADGWRRNHGLDVYADHQLVTNMATATVNKLWDAGFMPAGVYMNCDWYDNVIDMEQTGGAGLWLAQPGASYPDHDCMLWQYTFTENINGHEFDANMVMGGFDNV